MNSQLEEINVIFCRGRKTDGTQCKVEIQKKSKYCGKCSTKVDPQWFSSTVIICHSQRDDGSICENIFDDEDEYCTMCATPRPKPVATTELKMHSADTCIREKASSMVLTETGSNERGNKSEEHAVTVRTTEEALQAQLQVESSNGRRNISANQDTNKDKLHQGQISNLLNPDFIWLHFHVLVSPDFQWQMGQHKVYIDIDFNSFKITHEMEHVKQVQGYEEMHICIPVAKQVLEIGFKYIYAIYNQQKDKKKVEKYIYYKSGWTWTKVKYRSCLLPANLVQMNEYHQYDGIMNRYIGTCDHFTKISMSDAVKKLEKDAKMSAVIFTKNILLSTRYTDQETLNMLNMLLLGLEKRYLQDAKCWSSSQKEFMEKMATAILSPILESLESEIQTPLTGYTETQQQAERRMQVALFILTVIGHCKFSLSAQNRSLLAKFLLLRPHHQTGEFHDLAVITSLKEMRNLGIYMADFCNSFQMDDKDPSWLFCIPLLHFLSGHVTLDEPPAKDRRHYLPLWWGVESIQSTVEKFKCCPKRDWMISLKEIVSCLSPLFDLDYFLPRTLMFALQLNEVEMIIQTKTVPPEVCIVTCTRIINKLDSKTFSSPTAELKQIIKTTTTLKEFLAKFEAPGRWDDSLLLKHASLMRIFAEEMVTITFDRKPLTFEKKHLHDLLREVVQVFLEAMALYDTTSRKLPMKEDDFQNQMLQNVRHKVKKWLSKNFSSFTTTDFTDNLKRWLEMLCSKDFKSPFVAETWNTFLTDDFKKQWESEKVKGLACESTLVVQYCSLVDSLHPCMQSCLHNLALKVIPESYQISMQKLGVSERGHFGRLLSQWYENVWEDAMVQKDMEEDRMILHHILKWMPFSHFLKMFYGDERKCLSEECIKKIQQAISVIDDKVKTLQNGKITLRDLTEIKADVKFLELTSIITENAEDEQHLKGFDAAKALLVRQKEVDNYKKQMKYLTTLRQLCEHIPTVDLKDLDSTIERLMKQEDLCVRDICQPISVEIVTPDDCHPKITAFNLSDEVVTMLEPLQNLFESNIFMNLWSVIGHQANSASLEEVCENVWKPVSTKMEEITRKLVTGEIQFEEMEKYMGEVYQEDYNKMVYEMTIIKVPKEQADERIKQLRQFRQLETCFDGAKAISDLAKAYGLKGDLDVIKPFISQKHATKMMMKEFDDSLLKTSDILQTFIAERTACLNAFIDCKQLVLWIRESVKDLKELKVFVDLALISAGDREMEIARVNCLHAAITGFAPLIFCLDENSGYELLLDKCQILWKELESVPNLPQKLRDTQCHLEWLKTVKQAHGSVEITSLAEAEAINSNGIFLLGALGTSENARMVLKTFSMKCQQCNEHLSDDAVFCFNCGTAVSEPIILCSGKKKDGTPCGSRLQEGHKFCMKCGSPVNQGKQTLCKGVMKDGSTCSNLLKEEAEFCLNCGTAPGAKPSEVLSLCAKSDAENGPDNINMQQDSAFRFPVSSSPRPNEEIVKPSLFPIHSLPQSRSISENVKKNSLDGESQDMKREMKFKRKQVKKKNLDISNPCCLESLKDIQESPQKLVEKIDEKTADNSQPADTLEKGSIDHVHAVKEKVTIQETGNEINSDKDESENTENGHAVDDERTENQGKEIAPIQETRNGINSVMDKSENTGNGQVLSGKRTERIGASALETQSNTLVKEQVKESMEPEVGNLKSKKETGRRPKQNSKNLNMQQKHKVPVAKTTEVEEDKK